jgi:hypothetical protein
MVDPLVDPLRSPFSNKKQNHVRILSNRHWYLVASLSLKNMQDPSKAFEISSTSVSRNVNKRIYFVYAVFSINLTYTLYFSRRF